jgi:hypothetical protein
VLEQAEWVTSPLRSPLRRARGKSPCLRLPTKRHACTSGRYREHQTPTTPERSSAPGHSGSQEIASAWMSPSRSGSFESTGQARKRLVDSGGSGVAAMDRRPCSDLRRRTGIGRVRHLANSRSATTIRGSRASTTSLRLACANAYGAAYMRMSVRTARAAGSSTDDSTSLGCVSRRQCRSRLGR